MSEEVPAPALDEPLGDVADQASRLQMVEEQEAIRAALAGRVHGTDALEDRGPDITPLEGPDILDGDAMEASDDPVHAGGMTVGDPTPDRRGRDADLGLTGLEEDGAAMAVDEGSSVDDDTSAAAFEEDGDPAVLDADIELVDDGSEAEDLDALLEVTGDTHDPDDPADPDGYGVPPGSDATGDAEDDEEIPRID